MLEKNKFGLIVLTLAFSVCVLNTATHAACDTFDQCEDRRASNWICVRDFNNPSRNICYKAIPNRRDARECEERKDGSEWHYDDQECYRPRTTPGSPNLGPLPQPPAPTPRIPPSNTSSPVSDPQTPASDALSSPEANTLATVLRETIDRILVEDAIEPDGAPEGNTDPSEVETENIAITPDEDTAKPEDIFITEIMVDTLGDTLPQWIELTNYSTKEVNLKGWRMKIVNKFDENAYSKSKEVYLNNIVLGSSTSEGEDDKNRVALITFRLWGLKGRKSADLDLHDIFSYDLYRGYNILSKVAFRIELIPPPNMDRRKADVAGNLPKKTLLFELWDLPEQSEENRSSLIRRKNEGWMQSKGVSRDNWLLAHKTEFADEKPSTIWYGKDEDIGSPGRVDDPMMIDMPEAPAAPTFIRKLKLATSWGSLKKESE